MEDRNKAAWEAIGAFIVAGRSSSPVVDLPPRKRDRLRAWLKRSANQAQQATVPELRIEHSLTRWQAGRLLLTKEFIMNKTNVSKRLAKRLINSMGVAGALAFVTAQANAAAIDVTAITTGITEAQTAVLAVIAALLAMSTAIFGLSKVYAFVRRRAGA